MRPRDVVLGLLVAVVWGIAFVATKLALESFSPPQLTALRFLIAAAPAAFLPRPPIAWATLVAIGSTLFAGQFLLQFFGIAHGMPPGLASLTTQTQAFFTVLFAALVLGEHPSRRHTAGMGIALVGLVLIAATLGHDLTAIGFALTLASAVSWAIGNVMLKRVPRVDMLRLMVWLSLVPPLPSLALSMALDGPDDLGRAISTATWLAIGAALYLGLVATVGAYAIWGDLLRRHPAATVAPFALLVPLVGSLGSALVFGERFGPLRLLGMACVLLGVAVIVLEPPRARLAVSPARREDTPGVIELIGRVFQEYRWIFVPSVELPDLLAFERHYAPPRGAFWVVRLDGRIVGSVGVERLDDATAELHRLYLDAHLRGRGTGRALVEQILDWCRQNRIAHLVLWSDTRFDQAHRLYLRMGFAQTGERTLAEDVNQTREYRFERPVR